MKDKKTINQFKKSRGITFLILVAMSYLVLFLFKPEATGEALFQTGKTLLKIIPLLIFVILAIASVNLYVEGDKIKQHLGEGSGIKGWFWAILVGILVSGPVYIFFPFLRELKKRGTKNSLIVVFLYNRNIKILFFPVMIFYFGWGFTLISSIYIIIFSILNGLIIGYILNNKTNYKH